MRIRPDRRPRARPLTIAAGLVLSTLAVAAASPGQTWTIDPAGTEIRFQIQNLGSTVDGSFERFEIDLDYDPAVPESARVEARIQVASIDTGIARRDRHLQARSWFDGESHPTLIFRSTAVRRASPGRLAATGSLTIKGTTREVELAIELPAEPPSPARPARFEAGTSLRRKDFEVGTGWGAALAVGDEVTIRISVAASPPPADAP